MSIHGQAETIVSQPIPAGVPGQSYTSEAGVRIKMVNGEPMFSYEDVQRLVIEAVNNLPKETRPNVLAAQDARRVMAELTDGIGGDMETFRANLKVYLADIRTSRMGVVTETSQMVTSLRELRQFFIGSDHASEVKRLQEFVELCERLQKLKESGFLDTVADTMLRLAV